MIKTKPKSPRLQLRWEKHHDGARGHWLCHYELVVPLDDGDIRREIYKGGKKIKRELTEIVVPMKPPQVRETSSQTDPCTYWKDGRIGGELVYFWDTPYRDGAHAQWDAKKLGDLPVYAISPDGKAIEKPKDES